MDIIEVKRFAKAFGSFQAVKQLDFTVRQGEIFGFLGRNGAGKTTTLRALIGIYQADQGELLIQGRPYHSGLRNHLGYLPEERGIYTRPKVIDLVLYFARLRGLSQSEAQSRSKFWLERMGLLLHADKRVQHLSSGMQQKVQILLTLIHNPSILILDEPFRGLDPVNRALIYDLLKTMRKEGVTILFSSHEIHEIEHFCDRVILIASGEARAYGTVSEVKARFEPCYIHLHYTGTLPQIPKTEWTRVQPNYAELRFEKDLDPQLILHRLLEARVQIQRFEINQPSLNEVFLTLCGD